MSLFTPADRAFAVACSDLAHCNPFLPERIALERRALGSDFDESSADWNLAYRDGQLVNVERLMERSDAVLERAGAKLRSGEPAGDEDVALYTDLALTLLYHRYREGFDRTIAESVERRGRGRKIAIYERIVEDAQALLRTAGGMLGAFDDLPRTFAIYFQIRRAFGNIYGHIIGLSPAAAGLRAAVWQSIFTHDLRRYRRALVDRMADYTTLITGPSGTGKELVARAIGLSRFIPFDPKSLTFTEDFAGSFFAVNLSAMSPTLIESELFGHRRGAFTGAAEDRAGWLETCPPLGAVFLDEIGELDPVIQVKLLRTVQTRTFSRIGETTERSFRGKVIAATNRDLAKAMARGQFREDLYYRLCSDMITTPSLAQRITDHPGERRTLVNHLARRLVGEAEAPSLTDEVERWITAELGDEYPWPGNVRELEQCVRNVLIRKRYEPASRGPAGDARAQLLEEIACGTMSADDLLTRYCTLVYGRTGSYQAAARTLGLDRRTVKARVDRELLKQLGGA